MTPSTPPQDAAPMMNRYRFRANYPDWRSVVWPVVGPCWCSGFAGDETFSIVIAFAPDEATILRQWPEATAIEVEENCPITFSDRFPRPDWWPEGSE
jgi:hypothetical protein